MRYWSILVISQLPNFYYILLIFFLSYINLPVLAAAPDSTLLVIHMASTSPLLTHTVLIIYSKHPLFSTEDSIFLYITYNYF